ncbi:putative trafficking protein particle complex 1 [Paratrimastix pyriformis]|uniref:Trafficking protein particle complex subunit n=1 Tax=Paratrimastix pyriformis TaxID=342808 RepID=A0ABQ8UUP9_9EUKA|nr:putative trafficking protein particle complex 1 [Paratrimastix pyriformis]
MTIFNFLIFNPSGLCLYFKEFPAATSSKNNPDSWKLMYGLLHGLKGFSQFMAPRPSPSGRYLRCLSTHEYKLHCFETATCVRFVISTDPRTPDLHDQLATIYNTLYVEYVIKNPLYKLGDRIDCELFVTRLDSYLRSLPCFASS